MSDPAGNHKSNADRANHVRIGGMVFVPELTTRGPEDPWAHRKGEPRYFALFWTIYLLGSALLTVFSIRSVGLPTPQQFLLGGRGMALMCMLGVVPLWPMVRLSQASAPRALMSAFQDGLILAAPGFAVIMPISLLTGWTLEVSFAMSAVLLVWAFVSGAIVAIGHTSESRVSRFAWMFVLCGLALAAPLISWIGTLENWWDTTSEMPALIELLSPLSAALRLSEPKGGTVQIFDVTGQMWRWITMPCALAAGLWALAAVLARSSTRGRG